MATQGSISITNEKGAPKLTLGSVRGTLFRMAIPMLGGTFAMHAFNLTDTAFVSALGTLPLAAMGFSFPVVMLLACVERGLGTGAMAMTAHALGQGDVALARRITTHSIILTVLIIAVVSVVGILTIDPLFRALGAKDEVLPLIRAYMTIWYAGVAFMMLPMMCNDIIRTTGDTVRPSLLMVLSAVLNMVLDPIMIFGWLGFPAMGIRGAALATIIARGVSCVASFWVLHRYHGLLLFTWPDIKEMIGSWARVLRIGLPAMFSFLLMPLAGAIVTRIVAQHGVAAVAAFAAGGRIEMFAFMIPMCLGMSLVPFVGQNFGAGRMDRVRQARSQSMGFAFLFGLITLALFFTFAPQISRLFSKDPEVVRILTLYLRIVSLGHGLMEVHRYAGFFLNGIHRPMHAMGVNAFRIIVLLLPFTILGGWLFGLGGILWGRALTDIAAGLVGVAWSGAVIRRLADQTDEGAATQPVAA